MRDEFIARLLEEAKRDERILLITGDLGFKVFDEYRETLPKQFLNAGVAEQNMTGLAVGLALEGRTVFTYSIGNFPTLRCLEQIRNGVCYHDLNVTMVSIGAGFSYGALGMSHHATEDLSIMRSLPNMRVFTPGDNWEVREITSTLCQRGGPGFLRLDKSSAGETRMPDEQFVEGRARVLRDGPVATFVSAGGILTETLQAADVLAKEGFPCRVLQLPSVKPLDKEAIIAAARETGGIISVEEHNLDGGLGSVLGEVLLDAGCMPGSFLRVGLPNQFAPIVGSQPYLRKHYELDARSLVSRVKAALAESPVPKQVNL